MNDFISNALLNISPENACRLAKRYGADFTVDEAKIILPFLRLHKNELKKENKDKLLVLAKGKFPPSTYNKIAILVKKYS